MILSSKQLEELEHLHDSVADFDDDSNVGGDNEEFDEASEGALAWRRGMLERATATVRKYEKNPLNSAENYAVGSLVFDTQNQRFARIRESSSAQATLVYVSGGEAILKGSILEVTQSLKPMPSLSKKKTETKAAKAPAVKSVPAKALIKSSEKPPHKKDKAVASTKAPSIPVTPAKKIAKPVSAKKKPVKETPKKPAKKIVAIQKSAPKKPATEKPSDTNGFIKKNYKKMSNKELSELTGLSEHTIRRKLGEWGLKRLSK
ncbi:MAG: hypothetical protein I8H75_06420 [Myxococcaceae bacterium]|nr:hypothetical protein [Myxococcaceae bacterium]MBH2006950.1 hypothetical protein [Myxococcaceae bacterium]